MRKRIAIITGTRAEYGLLKPLIDIIRNDDDFDLKVIVTGAHLSHEFGYTYKEIESDGVIIDEKVEILMSSDSTVGVSKSVALSIMSFSEVFERIKPDMVLVLGDRYEIFGAASAACIGKIPIIHLCGGETTEGAFDEIFRHCITKMSYLHFTTTEEYRKRVIQLGENPDRVFNFGATGVENILTMNLLKKNNLEEEIKFSLEKPYGLVTFHPVTLEKKSSQEQFEELLMALDEVKGMNFIITKANADSDGRIINKMIDEYCKKNNSRIISFTSMGQLKYLSAMKYCSMVIGNSSSGIVEAPSFNKPTINIGDRQKGRVQALSTINCEPVKRDILRAIELARTTDFLNSIKYVNNPYGDGHSSLKIVEKIKEVLWQDINLKKKFYNIKLNIGEI